MGCRIGLFLLGSALLALGGCDRGTAADEAAPGAAHRAGPYFDVRGLLDAQVRQLAARHASATKQVSLRGSAPETVRVPQVKWADELQIFYQADLNKAALRGAYTVDSAAVPGGRLRRSYRLQPAGHDNASVQLLTVTSVAGQPQEISATLRQDNTLFYGQKTLQLSLQQGQLHSYRVRGVQKLVLFDTLHFQTAAQVQ